MLPFLQALAAAGPRPATADEPPVEAEGPRHATVEADVDVAPVAAAPSPNDTAEVWNEIKIYSLFFSQVTRIGLQQPKRLKPK